MTTSFLLLSLGMQITIVLIAYIAVRLHEWDLDRKHKHRQPGE